MLTNRLFLIFVLITSNIVLAQNKQNLPTSPVSANEKFTEKIKVYGIVKPSRITTLIGVNHGIVTQIEKLGTSLNDNQTALMVLEKETTRAYRTTIKGVVSKTHVTEGAAVTPGMPLITIIDPEMKEVEVSLSPQEAKKIQVGFKVLKNDMTAFAQITKLSPLIDPDTGAVISYVKPNQKIEELIGDVIPLYIITRVISDCDQIVDLAEAGHTTKDLKIESISDNKICLKKSK